MGQVGRSGRLVGQGRSGRSGRLGMVLQVFGLVCKAQTL